MAMEGRGISLIDFFTCPRMQGVAGESGSREDVKETVVEDAYLAAGLLTLDLRGGEGAGTTGYSRDEMTLRRIFQIFRLSHTPQRLLLERLGMSNRMAMLSMLRKLAKHVTKQALKLPRRPDQR